MVEKPDCGLCRKVKEAHGKKPDCKKCLGELWPENQIPFSIFWRIKGQVIMGPTYPVDLRMGTARAEISRAVPSVDHDYCLDLLMFGFTAYIGKIKEIQEAK